MIIESTRMHMQVDLNEERNLKDPDERKDAAKSCLNNANEFYIFISIIMNVAMSGQCRPERLVEYPMFVNEALAIELFLKAIVLGKKPDTEFTDTEIKKLRTHEIYKLFEMLDQHEQQAIYERYPDKEDIQGLDIFKKRIKEINKAFTVLRYAHERKRMGLDFFFLAFFTATLYEYANETLK